MQLYRKSPSLRCPTLLGVLHCSSPEESWITPFWRSPSLLCAEGALHCAALRRGLRHSALGDCIIIHIREEPFPALIEVYKPFIVPSQWSPSSRSRRGVSPHAAARSFLTSHCHGGASPMCPPRGAFHCSTCRREQFVLPSQRSHSSSRPRKSCSPRWVGLFGALQRAGSKELFAALCRVSSSSPCAGGALHRAALGESFVLW